MNRTILFSPVGGTDPIHNKNCRDGSMLHIARVYDVVDDGKIHFIVMEKY